MKVLMVTPYPPARDGIASYAVQEVRALRAEGHDVEVLSPEPSAAHHHLDLGCVRGALALARRTKRYDRVIVQYHPGLFGGSDEHPGQAWTDRALAMAFRRHRNVHLRIHEWESAPAGRPPTRARRAFVRSAREIAVHTPTERASLCKQLELSDARVQLVQHGARFVPRTRPDRDDARRRLGIPLDATSFLCIGFLQHHKGFDRAMRAFAGVEAASPSARPARLDVVGSARVAAPDVVGHVAELRHLAATIDGVQLHEQYVSDELFDRWIVASDVVVVPYRMIWSSSVVERAALLGRPVVATRVGGLAEQARPDWVLVSDDRELADALRRLAGATPIEHVDDVGASEGDVDWEALMASIAGRARASRGAPVDEDLRRRPSAPVRRVAPLAIPAPTSVRPHVRVAKRVVRRATGWEVDPVVGQVNELRVAMIEALEFEPDRLVDDSRA